MSVGVCPYSAAISRAFDAKSCIASTLGWMNGSAELRFGNYWRVERPAGPDRREAVDIVFTAEARIDTPFTAIF